MSILAHAGHNMPPDPIDEAVAPYADAISEAESWLDGVAVENEGQMKAVDDLTKQIKAALKDVKEGQTSEAAPHHDAHKAALARWKPTLDDLARIRDGLVGLVSGFKAKLAAEKKAAERAAWEAADKARREAEAKAAAADLTNIEAQREAAEAKQAALDAVKAAQAQAKDTVKGMRMVQRYEITDHKAALHHIAANDRDAMTAFIEDYVRRNFKVKPIAGVRVWENKEAF